MGERTKNVVDGNLAETIASLSATIHGRWDADPEQSYTVRLLTGKDDACLGKVVEEAGEVVMACKDDDHDHIRYEMADLLYHLLVVAERYGISLEELAGELDARMH